MIPNRCARLVLVSIIIALSGCDVWPRRAEFAAPADRWPITLPWLVEADTTEPPIRPDYCYRTLAVVDCYSTPQPERAADFTGAYPTIWP
jgi:hypothetical protein